MSKRFVWALAVALGWAALSASAQELNIGDAAPKLEFKEFVKGDPVNKIEKGKVYVVEFWATWCGPCRATIPHLTELQKKHKEAVFIGVSVFEEDPKAVAPFVKEMGEKMDYRVAIDAVPEGAKAGDGAMAKSWMQAAGQGGIPTAFIVNADGKIAWIGHPTQMDKPLDQVVAGTFDVEKAAKEFKTAVAQRRKLIELGQKLSKAQEAGDTKEVVAILEQAFTEDPKLETRLGIQKFLVLAGQEKDKAAEYGKRLVVEVLKDNADMLNNLAWMIVDPDKPKADAKLVQVALKAAQRADELTKGKNPAILDTLAKALFDSGDAAKALEAQEKAVKLAKGTQFESDEGMKARLDQYRKVVEDKKDK